MKKLSVYLPSCLSGFIIVVLSIILLLCSCAVRQWQPVCRHDAVYCAITAGEEVPVRFVYGTYGREYHVIAQAYLGGKWIDLEVERKGLIVAREGREYFEVTHIFSYSDYMDRVKARIREKVEHEK